MPIASLDVPARRERGARGTIRLACALAAALGGGCATLIVTPPSVEKPAGPLSLDAAIALAIRNSPDVWVAEERLNAAQAAIDLAESAFWPTVIVSERFTRTDTPSRAFSNILDQGNFDDSIDFNDPGATTNFRTGIAGGLTLYDGGRRGARVRAAEAREASLEAERVTLVRDLAYEVARAFFLVHQARAAADAAERADEALERRLGATEARFEEGAARRSDVLDARLRRAEAREAAVVARVSASRAEAALGTLLGIGAAEPFELLAPPEDPIDETPPLDDVLRRARANRFELARARSALEEAWAVVDAARASVAPEIGAFGDFGFDDENLMLTNSSWLFGLALVEDLADALRTPYRVRAAVSGLAVAMAEARKAMLGVEDDVRNAILDAEAADARAASAGEAVALADARFRRVEAEYEEGASDPASVLEARFALTRAEAGLEVATLERRRARVALAHAAGEFPEPPRAAPEVEEP